MKTEYIESLSEDRKEKKKKEKNSNRDWHAVFMNQIGLLRLLAFHTQTYRAQPEIEASQDMF